MFSLSVYRRLIAFRPGIESCEHQAWEELVPQADFVNLTQVHLPWGAGRCSALALEQPSRKGWVPILRVFVLSVKAFLIACVIDKAVN